MRKIPDSVKFLYESFPEKKILRRQIEVLPKDGSEYTKDMENAGVRFYHEANVILKSLPALDEPLKINVAAFKLSELGLSHDVTLNEIYKKAEELGLKICPPQLGPALRLQYTDQDPKEVLAIAMEQRPDPDNHVSLGVFFVEYGYAIGPNEASDGGFEHYGDTLKFVFQTDP